MVYYCCVPSCNNNGKDVHMHRFPVNRTPISDIWLRRIAREDLQTLNRTELYKNYRICEEHFYQGCILPTSSRRLKLGSLPISYLGEDCIMVPRCKGSFKTNSGLEMSNSSAALEGSNPITECSITEESYCAAQGSTVPSAEKNHNSTTPSETRNTSPTAGCSRMNES